LFEALGSAKALAPDMDLHEYVMARVRNAMVEQIQMANPGVAEVRAQSRQIARAMKLLGAGTATSEAIASALKLSLSDYDRMLQTIWEAGIARIEVLPFDRVGPVVSGIDTTPVATLTFAVEALPQPSQRVLMLVYQADCSLAEAALVLGWSESRAIATYTEAIHRVRALIGKE
jgi:DNA-directed RNA polymerase specialized sigma subunit